VRRKSFFYFIQNKSGRFCAEKQLKEQYYETWKTIGRGIAAGNLYSGFRGRTAEYNRSDTTAGN
jgi:hypothetical protein